MKKALLVCKGKRSFKNIGDYIQSVAGEQYTGNDAVLVQREETHNYAGEPVKMIMNGWFMHYPENWPPSENILPLLTSVHLNPEKCKVMLNEKGVNYFNSYVNKYGPIGARDKGTRKILEAKGIPTFFSGCLTLTLGKTYKHNPEAENVCFVDAHHQVRLRKNLLAVLKYFFTVLAKRKTISAIAMRLYRSDSFKDLLRTAQFYQAYSKFFKDDVLKKAEYIKHIVPESNFATEDAKLEYARNLLRKYANSRLVVTSRIHAALPCLGIGTPVIFVLGDDLHPNGKGLQPDAKGRFDGLIDLFHVMEYMNFKLKPILGFKVAKKIGLDHTIKNKPDYLQMAEELDKSCTAFVEDAKVNLMETPCDDKIRTYS
jgi:hypothetical protein